MIRLTDEQWERIRDHFPEEHIGDGRPGRKPTWVWGHLGRGKGAQTVARVAAGGVHELLDLALGQILTGPA